MAGMSFFLGGCCMIGYTTWLRNIIAFLYDDKATTRDGMVHVVVFAVFMII